MEAIVRKCRCLRPVMEEQVRVLDYKHCCLREVPAEVFNGERTLEELYLDNNQIRDLPRELFFCHGLRKLSVSDNLIVGIPLAIGGLSNLEHLDISKNGIIDVPDDIKKCKYLRSIDVSVNPLGRLPEGFTCLGNLTHLQLNDTSLDYLPGSTGRMIKLKILELRENHIKILPASLSRLALLEKLDIGFNELTELGDVIGELQNLFELWCDNNQITQLTPSVGHLQNLMFLDASHNKLCQLPAEIGGCISLTDLHVSFNKLSLLPDSLDLLENLVTLRLEFNQLTSLPHMIGRMSSLSELNVSANRLQELPASFGLLRNLRTFYADGNCLRCLPAEIGSCVGMTVMSLRNNYLKYIPDEVGHMSHLRVVNLSGNLLQDLPFSIIKLKELQALWLADNQTRPLIPMQSDHEAGTGRKRLTCYLLPQCEFLREDDSIHSSSKSAKTTLSVKLPASNDDLTFRKRWLRSDSNKQKKSKNANRLSMPEFGAQKMAGCRDIDNVRNKHPNRNVKTSNFGGSLEDITLRIINSGSTSVQTSTSLYSGDSDCHEITSRDEQHTGLVGREWGKYRPLVQFKESNHSFSEKRDSKEQLVPSHQQSPQQTHPRQKPQKLYLTNSHLKQKEQDTQGHTSSSASDLEATNTCYQSPKSIAATSAFQLKSLRSHHTSSQSSPHYTMQPAKLSYSATVSAVRNKQSSLDKASANHPLINRTMRVCKKNSYIESFQNEKTDKASLLPSRAVTDFNQSEMSDTVSLSSTTSLESEHSNTSKSPSQTSLLARVVSHSQIPKLSLQKLNVFHQRTNSDIPGASHNSTNSEIPRTSHNCTNRDTSRTSHDVINNDTLHIALQGNVLLGDSTTGKRHFQVLQSDNSISPTSLKKRSQDTAEDTRSEKQMVQLTTGPVPPRLSSASASMVTSVPAFCDGDTSRMLPSHQVSAFNSGLVRKDLSHSQASAEVDATNLVCDLRPLVGDLPQAQVSEVEPNDLPYFDSSCSNQPGLPMSQVSSPDDSVRPLFMTSSPTELSPIDLSSQKELLYHVTGFSDIDQSDSCQESPHSYIKEQHGGQTPETPDKQNREELLALQEVSSSTDSGFCHGQNIYERVVKHSGKDVVLPSKQTSRALLPEFNTSSETALLINSPRSNHTAVATSSEDLTKQPFTIEKIQKQKFRFTLHKSSGLGFSIAGGIGSHGNPFREEDIGVFVTKVISKGPASKFLRRGDKILEVNKVDFSIIDHNQAVAVLKRNNPVTIIIERLEKVQVTQ